MILMAGRRTRRCGSGSVGAEYEIDLNKKNVKAFCKQLAPFVENARRAGRGQRRGLEHLVA
jgi:hypothetical protein